MLCLNVPAFSPANSDVDVAFCARFYSQGSGRSYAHLYVCRHDGTGKRQLTFGARSSLGPMWIDRDRIAFFEIDGDTPPSFSHADTTWTGRIVVLSLKSGRRRVLRRVKTLDPWARFDQDARTVAVGGYQYRVSAERAERTGEKVGEFDEPPFDSLSFGHQIGEGGQDETTWQADVPTIRPETAYRLQWSQAFMDERQEQSLLRVTQNQLTKSFLLKEGAIGWAKAVGPSSLYVISEPGFRKFIDTEFLYQLDFDKGTSKVLVSDAGQLKVDLGRQLWLGSKTDPRPLSTLRDGRKVWVNWLYAGDWAAGKRWEIATGLVYVSGFQFRPVGS